MLPCRTEHIKNGRWQYSARSIHRYGTWGSSLKQKMLCRNSAAEAFVELQKQQKAIQCPKKPLVLHLGPGLFCRNWYCRDFAEL